jgi:hypothetical protein
MPNPPEMQHATSESFEVNDGDIALLAIVVAPPDPLLDTLRAPRQIVIDDGLAELKVKPFPAARDWLRPKSASGSISAIFPHSTLLNTAN